MSRKTRTPILAAMLMIATAFLMSFGATGSGADTTCPSNAEMELDAAYRMVFDREPDAAGMAFWLANFELYPYGHLGSSEEGSGTVVDWYDNLFGRSPSPQALAFWSSVPKAEALRGIAASPEAQDLFISERGCTTTPVAQVSSIEQRIRETFPESPNTALAIAWCESRHKLDAVGPDGNDLGLFQVRWSVHHRLLSANGISRADLFTLEGNLKGARLVWEESQSFRSNGGWGAWTCFRLI